MALKPTRITAYGNDDVRHFMAVTAERGIVVTYGDNSPSGNLDDPLATVIIPTGGVGTPVGILTCDVVNKDLTQTHLSAHKDEVQVNGKVSIMKRGQCQTDQTASTPSPGDPAYFTTNGQLTTSAAGDATHRIGTFVSSVDSDGYVVVDVDPQRLT
jgi:hypothetical protein